MQLHTNPSSLLFSTPKAAILLAISVAMTSSLVAAAPMPFEMMNSPLTNEIIEHHPPQIQQLYEYVQRVLPAESHSPLQERPLPYFGSSASHTPVPHGERTFNYASKGRSDARIRLDMDPGSNERVGSRRGREVEVVQQGQRAPPNTPERHRNRGSL
ncbi:uncharacterized protein UHOD_08306 [Ustilago sp. UG-2017b]|nr:uncharacterized protein UHOD_08306 [Ustilago sp. UG-2017b]